MKFLLEKIKEVNDAKYFIYDDKFRKFIQYTAQL
jgi:hypothetical protein